MTSTTDRENPGPELESILPISEESADQRRQREADEADEAWDQSEKTRRKAEIQRRVKEQWRNPLT